MIVLIILLFNFTLLLAPKYNSIPIGREQGLFEKEYLSWASVNYWIDFYEIKHPDIVKAQIRLETGNLKSRFCLECNNLFGMNKPRKRETTAIGIDNLMSVYNHFSESIQDYKLWQDYFYRGGDYYTFLIKRKYAEDKRYIEKLKLYE